MPKIVLSEKARFLVQSVSVGLIIIGITVFAWALANTARPTNYSYVPGASFTRMDWVESLVATASVDATGAAGQGRGGYPTDPDVGDILGTLTIPALKQSFPVIEGTGDEELKAGVGRMVQTAMPGEPDNCVISGHRDTVFTRLGELEKGDLLIIETATGVHTYKIQRIRIVDKDDRTVVVPTDRARLSVSTCYPFRYVGSAPDRYVLIAGLVSSK